MLDRLYSWITGRFTRRQRRLHRQRAAVREFQSRLSARYDAAQTTAENEKHWAQADGFSPDWAMNPGVRRTLVIRSRYERDNNCYASGIVDTMVNDLVGTGPRLQVQESDPIFKAAVETRWKEWTEAIGFAEKLRTYTGAYFVDGEGISQFFDNPKVNDPVSLDFQLIETDRLTTPGVIAYNDYAVDGIDFDFYGNPKWYHLLRHHPGDYGAMWGDVDNIPPAFLTHWFKKIRPSQSRGIPWFTPSLPLFAQLRRYTLAVLTAAEIAANHAAVIETDMLPGEEDVDDADAFKEFAITRGLLTALPAGTKMGQFDAKQPVNTYEMFKRELITEIARALCVPYNIAAGTSMNYNYSSGRLDHLIYFNMVRVLRESLRLVKVKPTFSLWYKMGCTVDGYFPAVANKVIPKHTWHWDSRRSIDPEKDAKADTERLNNGTATLAEIYAEDGKDWEEQMAQRFRERQIMARQEANLLALGGIPNAA